MSVVQQLSEVSEDGAVQRDARIGILGASSRKGARVGARVAKEAGNPPQLWKTWAAIGELRRLRRDEGGAIEAYAEASAVVREVADGLTDENLRATFLASEHVRAIEAAAGTGASEASR